MIRQGLCLQTVVLLGVLLAPGAATQETDTYVFENVTVVPMDRERTIPAQTVVIQAGRIAAIGPAGSTAIPAGAVRINGSGKYLMPGLAEMHGHVPSPPNAQARAVLGDDYHERVLFLFVSAGITTVRGMLGHPDQLGWRNKVATGEIVGPQLFLAGPSLNGNSVPNREAAWRLVTDQRAAGYDLLKIHLGIRRDVYDDVVEVAQRERIPFAGHVPLDVGLERALVSGQASIEHLDGYMEYLAAGTEGAPSQSQFFGLNLAAFADVSKIAEVATATRNAGAWNTPTQILFENRFNDETVEEIGSRSHMRYMPRAMIEQWMNATRRARESPGLTDEVVNRFMTLRRQIIKTLSDQGAKLLLGADAPQVFNVPGYATVEELGALVRAGLTPYQALVAGTRNPAEYFGLEETFGTVEEGKRADLVLLEGNPLDEIGNVSRRAGVMVGGRWLSTDEIARRLEEWALRN